MFKLSPAAGFLVSLSAWAAPAPAQAGAPVPPGGAEREAGLNNRLAFDRPRGPRGQRAAYGSGGECLRKYGEPEDDVARDVGRRVLKHEAAVRRFYQPLMPEAPAGAPPACRRGRPQALSNPR